MNDRQTPKVPMREFGRSLPMALMRARESVMGVFRPVLSEHDLSEQQWRVLRALTDAAGPLSVGEVAERTFLLGPSLSRMLVTLEDRKLIVRKTDALDARRSEIAVTRKGLALVAKIAPRSEQRYEAIEAQLGPKNVRDLYRLLELVAAIEPPDLLAGDPARKRKRLPK
jgi:homoprotocatechuate degradation regulator HpaR